MSEIRWVHRAFNDEDRDRVLALRNEVFGEDTYDQKRWQWQYKDNPMGVSVIDLAVDVEDSKKLAGHYAVISYDIQSKNHAIKGAQSLDTFTSGEYRRQGIFVNLAEETYKRSEEAGIDFIFGFPNKNSYPGFVQKLSFIDPFGFGMFKLPLRAGYFLNRFIGNTPVSSIPLKFKNIKLGLESKKVTRLGDCFDRVASKFTNQFPYMVKRDRKYFEWRYVNCPDRKYEIYECSTDSKVVGYFVLSPDESNNYVNLIDIIVSDKKYYDQVIGEIINKSIEGKYLCLISFINEKNAISNIFNTYGFKYTDRSEDFRFIIRDLKGNLDDSIKDSSKWYILAGDTDFY